MKKPLLLLVLIFAGLYLSAEDHDCPPSSSTWKSEKDAILRIENETFEFSESATVDADSWIQSMVYYSCDMEFGYLIVKCDKKSYLHQKVPVGVWKALKEANSKGGYYNFYIKNHFKFESKDQKDAA